MENFTSFSDNVSYWKCLDLPMEDARLTGNRKCLLIPLLFLVSVSFTRRPTFRDIELLETWEIKNYHWSFETDSRRIPCVYTEKNTRNWINIVLNE